jgi:hypothetical protein
MDGNFGRARFRWKFKISRKKMIMTLQKALLYYGPRRVVAQR